MRERGAIAWKVLVAVVATAGGVWAATLLSSASSTNEALPDGAGEAAPARIAQTVQPSATGTPSAPATPQDDPFAGVDVSSNSVLRHIAGIEEKQRAKLAAKRTPQVAAPADTAPAPRADAPSPAPVRQEPAADARARPSLTTALPAPSSAASNDAARATGASAPAQTVVAAPQTSGENPAPAPLKTPTAAPSRAVPAAERTPLAAARIEPPPVPVVPALRIVNRTVPEFPGEAIRAGVQSGRVVARLTIDGEGRVTGTQVLSANPTGFFERESRRALSTWRYEPPGREMTTDVELVFTRE